MDVYVFSDPELLGAAAADVIADIVASKPAAVLGLATGSSPLGVYEELAKRGLSGETDYSQVRGFALDEYVGLSPEHPQSYTAVIHRTVTGPLRLEPSNVHVPDGQAHDLPAACAEFERRLALAGGVDVQIVGIGVNGHIGFNEPGAEPTSTTRVTPLAPATRLENARFFESIDEVPTHSITQGLSTVVRARKIILIAQGERKAKAVAAALEGAVSADCPASILQTHPDVLIMLDTAAAAELRETGSYVFVNSADEANFSSGASSRSELNAPDGGNPCPPD